MKPLRELPLEMKALVTATLVFAGIAVLMGVSYVDVSHRGIGGSVWIGPNEIAATYYGPGVSVATLVSLAHIHMLGLLSVFWVIGYIFVHSSFSPRTKAFWSVLPFAGFLADVSGWFLTKANPSFVYLVILGGAVFVLSLAVMILLSLHDMWLARVKTRRQMVSAMSSGDSS